MNPSRQRELAAVCRDMHTQVVATLIVASQWRLTPGIQQRLLDIYEQGIARAALVGELHAYERDDDDLTESTDADQFSLADTQPGFRTGRMKNPKT